MSRETKMAIEHSTPMPQGSQARSLPVLCARIDSRRVCRRANTNVARNASAL